MGYLLQRKGRGAYLSNGIILVILTQSLAINIHTLFPQECLRGGGTTYPADTIGCGSQDGLEARFGLDHRTDFGTCMNHAQEPMRAANPNRFAELDYLAQ